MSCNICNHGMGPYCVEGCVPWEGLILLFLLKVCVESVGAPLVVKHATGVGPLMIAGYVSLPIVEVYI